MKSNPFSQLLLRAMDSLSRISVQQEDVVGVDITPSYVRVAQLSKKGGAWSLEKLGYKYLGDAGNQADILSHPDLYTEKLREITSSAKLSTLNAAISIPITSAIIRVIPLPLMSDEEVMNAIALDSLWENVVQISGSLADYSIFWQIIRRNTAANTMDILFVASKLSDINAYSKIVTAAGLNPVLVDVRCFANRNVLALLPGTAGSGQASAILEFGLHENYLLIVSNDKPFISDLYMSEADRALLCSRERDEAALSEVCNRYASQVRQALRAFKSHDPAGEIGQIRVTSSLTDTQKFIQMLTVKLPEYKLNLLDATEFLTVPAQLKGKLEAEQNRSVFTAALGLATRKLDIFGYYKYVTGVNNINLLPNRDAVRQTEKKKIFSTLLVVVASFLVVLVAGFMFWYQSSAEETLAPQVAQADQTAAEVNLMKTRLAQLQSQRKANTSTIEATESFLSGHARLEGALNAITQTVPRSVRLTVLAYDGGEMLRIEGEAPNEHLATVFLEKLNAGGMLQRATLIDISSGIEFTGTKFRFNALLNPPLARGAEKQNPNRAEKGKHGA